MTKKTSEEFQTLAKTATYNLEVSTANQGEKNERKLWMTLQLQL